MLMLAIVAVSALVLAGCNRHADAKGGAKEPVALLVGPEDVLVLQPGTLVSGPLITGTLQPERRADLRAEVSAARSARATCWSAWTTPRSATRWSRRRRPSAPRARPTSRPSASCSA
jgi:hypothetical protein